MLGIDPRPLGPGGPPKKKCFFGAGVSIGAGVVRRHGIRTTQPKETAMRVMVLVKANKESEEGQRPDEKIMGAMMKFNEELVKAGVMLAGEGLRPSSAGKRVRFDARKTVIDGPFAETKELGAGYWLWQVRSIDEAVEWLKRAPFGGGSEVEIRPIFESEDFAAALSPE